MRWFLLSKCPHLNLFAPLILLKIGLEKELENGVSGGVINNKYFNYIY